MLSTGAGTDWRKTGGQMIFVQVYAGLVGAGTPVMCENGRTGENDGLFHKKAGGSPHRTPAGSWVDPFGLLVEHELLGVDQRPEDVLVGDLLVRLACLVMWARAACMLFAGRLAGEGPQEQFLDLLGVGPRVLGQQRRPGRPRGTACSGPRRS